MRNVDEFRLRHVYGIAHDTPAVGTVRIHPATAIFAARAGGDAGDQDMITSLEAAHRSAHLFDDPDTFMAENPARLASGDIALENVQVSAANRRFRDPHNRVGRRLQVGLGAFVEAFLARTVINRSEEEPTSELQSL